MRLNPFAMVNKEEVYKKVERMRRQYPHLSERELCDLIIAEKSRLCGLTGALTALPATFPVIGTAVTLIGGTAVDMAAVSYFMAQMVLEMSAVYGRDLNLPGVSREAVWVMASAVGADVANKTVSKAAVRQMGNQAFVRLVQELLKTLGIRATQRTVLRIIPLLGAVISGTINYFICRRVGRIAADYYARNSWTGHDGEGAIDVEGEVVE